MNASSHSRAGFVRWRLAILVLAFGVEASLAQPHGQREMRGSRAARSPTTAAIGGPARTGGASAAASRFPIAPAGVLLANSSPIPHRAPDPLSARSGARTEKADASKPTDAPAPLGAAAKARETKVAQSRAKPATPKR